MMKHLFTVLVVSLSLHASGQQKKIDSVAYYHHRADSLHTKLIVANAKIEKVTYYLNICRRNPKQVKFLKGWLGRALQ